MDETRRSVIATGVAATAMAAAPGVFAQPAPVAAPGTAFFTKGSVRQHYEDQGGNGFPMLCIPGPGLNSTLETLHSGPFDPFKEFASIGIRCIAQDQRNAYKGQSTGPMEIDRPWDSHTDDQINLMDHLGINKFMVIGFCAGAPYAWNLYKRAPDRVVAIIEAQPAGFRPEIPTATYDGHMKDWAPFFLKQRPEYTMDQVTQYMKNMYFEAPGKDFFWTVTRDFVKQSKVPVLIMPDDVAGHPMKIAMETAGLAQNSQVSMYPWKDTPEHTAIALRHTRMFIKANLPAKA